MYRHLNPDYTSSLKAVELASGRIRQIASFNDLSERLVDVRVIPNSGYAIAMVAGSVTKLIAVHLPTNTVQQLLTLRREIGEFSKTFAVDAGTGKLWMAMSQLLPSGESRIDLAEFDVITGQERIIPVATGALLRLHDFVLR